MDYIIPRSDRRDVELTTTRRRLRIHGWVIQMERGDEIGMIISYIHMGLSITHDKEHRGTSHNIFASHSLENLVIGEMEVALCNIHDDGPLRLLDSRRLRDAKDRCAKGPVKASSTRGIGYEYDAVSLGGFQEAGSVLWNSPSISTTTHNSGFRHYEVWNVSYPVLASDNVTSLQISAQSSLDDRISSIDQELSKVNASAVIVGDESKLLAIQPINLGNAWQTNTNHGGTDSNDVGSNQSPPFDSVSPGSDPDGTRDRPQETHSWVRTTGALMFIIVLVIIARMLCLGWRRRIKREQSEQKKKLGLLTPEGIEDLLRATASSDERKEVKRNNQTPLESPKRKTRSAKPRSLNVSPPKGAFSFALPSLLATRKSPGSSASDEENSVLLFSSTFPLNLSEHEASSEEDATSRSSSPYQLPAQYCIGAK